MATSTDTLETTTSPIATTIRTTNAAMTAAIWPTARPLRIPLIVTDDSGIVTADSGDRDRAWCCAD